MDGEKIVKATLAACDKKSLARIILDEEYLCEIGTNDILSLLLETIDEVELIERIIDIKDNGRDEKIGFIEVVAEGLECNVIDLYE